MIRLPANTEITTVLLQKLLDEHKKEVNDRYEKLLKAYESDHEILHSDPKPKYKPDNRIVVNFAKYIVDTTNGFFIGNPIKTVAEDKAVSEFVEYVERYNNQDDNNAELSKLCDIFGKGYEMYYTDEESELCITYQSPIDAFMVFDDSILERPLFFIRRYTDYESVEWGSISNSYGVRHFKVTGGIQWIDPEWQPHHFNGVPATEFVENKEKQGLFEPVMTDINAYNKAISEKANDVDYFADAYLKILGVLLEDEELKCIRDNRIINLAGNDDELKNIIVEFMDKPNNDTTQENLLDRLERHIFQIPMVANISDENFGGSSGEALKHRTQNMKNLFKVKERKFTSGMNRRYKLLFGHPASKVPADAWLQLSYNFFPNVPTNLKEESETAKNLEGIVSHETQLKTLSIVDNVEKELEKIEEENAKTTEAAINDTILGFGNTTPNVNEPTAEPQVIEVTNE